MSAGKEKDALTPPGPVGADFPENEISRAVRVICADVKSVRDTIEKAEARAKREAVARLSPYAAQADRIDEIAKGVKDLLGELVAEVRARRQDIEVAASTVSHDARLSLPDEVRVDPSLNDAVEAMKTLGSRIACVVGKPMPLGSEELVGPDFHSGDIAFVRALAKAAEPGDGIARMELALRLVKDMTEDLKSMRSKKAKLNGRVLRFEAECRKAKEAGQAVPETPPEVAVARKKLSELQKVFESFAKKLQKVLELYYDSRKKLAGRIAGLSEQADMAFAEAEIDTCGGIARFDVSAHLNSIIETDNRMIARAKAKTRKERGR